MQGYAHVYGDNVDTDVIIPARVLNDFRPEALAAHAMEDIDPEFVKRVQPGDIVVAGENFGCGSSREHAPLALKAAGIRAVVAKSFARIFFRNAINIGLPLFVCAVEANTGDLLAVTFDGEIENLTAGKAFAAQPLPEFAQRIVAGGGLLETLRERPRP